MCRGKPFTTSFWVCQDGIQKIPVSLVCDDPIKPDCKDGSDEDKARCQGEGDQNVTIVIGSYFLLGFFGVLLGKVTTLTVLHETLKKVSFSVLICFHDNDDDSENETNEELVDHFDPELVKVLTVSRSFKEVSDLTMHEKDLLKQRYLEMRTNGKVDQLYYLLRSSADAATIEKVVDFLKTIELEFNSDDLEKVLEDIASRVPDLELRSWILSQYKQGFGYSVEKQCKIWCGPLFNVWVRFQVQILPIFLNLFAISCPHFDWYKDFFIYFGLQHFCTFVLVS